MPRRLTPLVSGEIYHVFNKGIASEKTFLFFSDYNRAMLTLRFYQFSPFPVKLSKYLVLKEKRKNELLSLAKPKKIVSIICFVFMPNHFHFLVKQEVDGGISKFVGNFQNSYTRYFNTKYERIGGLFLTQFKAVRIKTNNHLYHVSRYIHLNPYSAGVVGSKEELKEYKWSSFPEYIGKAKRSICDKDIILKRFGGVDEYKKFVLDQADYQRSLEKIKKLMFED